MLRATTLGAMGDRLKLVLAAMLFSTGGAAIKATTLDAWQVACFRSGVAVLTIFILMPASRRAWTWRTLAVGACSAVTLVLFVTANKLTTAANTIFLQSTAPIYLLVLSPLLLRERVRREDLLFMGVVGLGFACFFVDVQPPLVTAPNPARGNLLAALSGVTWAITVAGLRWMSARDGEHAGLRAVVAGNAIAFVCCLPLALPLVGTTAADWATIGYLGVFQIGVAYMFVTSGLRTVPAFEASILLLVEPALNPIWAWLVHGERPGLWALTGGAVILGATTFKAWLDARALEQPV